MEKKYRSSMEKTSGTSGRTQGGLLEEKLQVFYGKDLQVFHEEDLKLFHGEDIRASWLTQGVLLGKKLQVFYGEDLQDFWENTGGLLGENL